MKLPLGGEDEGPQIAGIGIYYQGERTCTRDTCAHGIQQSLRDFVVVCWLSPQLPLRCSTYRGFLENHLTKSRLLVDWGSKLQVSVAGSTPDAELAAVHRSTLRSSIPMQLMIEGLYEFETPIFHECDNSPCLKTIENGASETLRYLAKTQRVSIPLLNSIFHSSHDSNDISHIGTEYNTADIFTKFLGALKHSTFSP